MAQKMTAIDWQKIKDLLDKAPAILLLVKQLLDLFQRQPMAACPPCPHEDLACCCQAAIDAQLRSLLHLAHLHDSCCPKED